MLRYACRTQKNEAFRTLLYIGNNWLNVLFCQESVMITFHFIKCQIILIHRLQRIQLATATFVTGKYADLSDILKLVWLPVRHNMNWNLCKLAYKALICEKWPPLISPWSCVFTSALYDPHQHSI